MMAPFESAPRSLLVFLPAGHRTSLGTMPGGAAPGRPAEELLVALEGRPPQLAVRHAHRTDRVVGDELVLGLLDLHELAELRELARLALADRFGVRLDEAQDFVGIVNVPRQDPGPRLLNHAPDEAQ